VEVIARPRNGYDGQRCRLPRYGFVHLGYRNIEALAQLVLKRTHDLTTVLERLGMLDADLECELGDRHVVTVFCIDSVSRDRTVVRYFFFTGGRWLVGTRR